MNTVSVDDGFFLSAWVILAGASLLSTLHEMYLATRSCSSRPVIKPQRAADAENAIYSLNANFNIDASQHIPRDIRLLDLTRYSLFIALDNRVASVLEELGVGASKINVWPVKDPQGPDLTDYDRACLRLKREILRLKDSVEAVVP